MLPGASGLAGLLREGRVALAGGASGLAAFAPAAAAGPVAAVAAAGSKWPPSVPYKGRSTCSVRITTSATPDVTPVQLACSLTGAESTAPCVVPYNPLRDGARLL